MPLNDRLKTRVKRFTTAATAAAVTGNLASDADASLNIWDVGQTGTPVNTVTLTANFQSNFQLAFRGVTWASHGTTSSVSSSNFGWQVLMDSRSNLSHINSAKWNSGVMIGADANNGVASAGIDSKTAHSWKASTSNPRLSLMWIFMMSRCKSLKSPPRVPPKTSRISLPALPLTFA